MVTHCIVLAAGIGKRMKSEKTKQFIEVEGKPIIYYTLQQFVTHPLVDGITLVVNENEVESMKDIVILPYFKNELIAKKISIVIGGEERYNSVYNGLNKLEEKVTHVLIHDGARPLISHQRITEMIELFKEQAAIVIGVVETNTMKKIDNDNYIEETVPREKLVIIQTPQGFEKNVIVHAYEKGMKNPQGITDDAMMVEKYSDVKVKFMVGDSSNIKVTTSEDLVTLKSYLNKC